MTDIKHEGKGTSTHAKNCSVCHEWERDMNGTVATLKRQREINKELLSSLPEMVRICEAMRFSVGLGRNQLQRIERAKTAIAQAARA